MGQISINTPDGVKTGLIDGETPTAEDLDRIRKAFPAPAGETFDYSLVLPGFSPSQRGLIAKAPVEAPVEAPDPTRPVGEVDSSWLRFQLGRMDIDEEKQNLLNQLLGVGTSERVAEDTFVIDQAKVDPRTREKYGLADTGRIYLDKPGLSWNDLADFGGEAGPELIAAIGTSLLVSGYGFLPGALMVGAAAGLVKGLDEAIEWQQGLNRQSAGEVASMIGLSAIVNATGEVGGRVVVGVGGRLIKGPGPHVPAKRVAELTRTYEQIGVDRTFGEAFMQGFARPKTLAARTAREEALAKLARGVEEGARPTVESAAGKGLSARAQAIYEKLFKNQKVGQANFNYVTGVLKKLDDGILNEEEALKLLDSNNTGVSGIIAGHLANPDEAFDLSQQHLRNIVARELKDFNAAFVPSEKLPQQYTGNLQLAATLFRTESANLYDIAGKTIGKEGLFDLSPVIATLNKLKSDNPFVVYSGSLFNKMQERSAIQGGVSVGELQQLKAALRIARGDTELVSGAAQGGINKILRSVDDLMKNKQIELAEQVARGYRIEAVPAGSGKVLQTQFGDVPLKFQGITYRKVTLNPSELENLRRGLNEWEQANKFWAEGQKQFNNTALNTILKSAEAGFITSDVDVIKVAIEAGNAPKLAMYLQAVTPTKNGAQKLTQPGVTDLIENVRKLVDLDQFQAAEDLVRKAGLGKIIPKIQGFIDELPANDVFRVSQKEAYLQQLSDLAQLSRAGANPQMIRESVRNSLAKTWINQTREAAEDSVGQFHPAQFATKFAALGEDLQNALFGNANAKLMREAMEVFQLSATEKTAQDLFNALPTLVNQELRTSIQSLKAIYERGALESQDALLSAINSGSIKSPLELVAGVLKDPTSYKRLANVVGDDELAKVGGLKDMVMNNLLQNGVKGSLDEGTIQSGAWGKSLKSAIKAQNKNGALNSILGAETVEDLTKLADTAVEISDASIAGFGGLQQAAVPLALLAMVASFHLPTLATAAGTVTTMLAMSRFLRTRGVLKILTSPKVRANEYKRAIAAGADLPSQKILKEQGPVVYHANRLSRILATQSSLVAASGLPLMPFEESAKRINEGFRVGLEQLQRGDTGGPGGYGALRDVTPPEPGLSYERVIRGMGTNVPGGGQTLREIEENKLRGGPPLR